MTVHIPSDPIHLWTDDEVRRATARAFNEAGRCWHEANNYVGGDAEVARVLSAAAISAQRYWERLNDERYRRMSVEKLPCGCVLDAHQTLIKTCEHVGA